MAIYKYTQAEVIHAINILYYTGLIDNEERLRLLYKIKEKKELDLLQ